MNALITFPDDSPSFLRHNNSRRYLQEIQKNYNAPKRIDRYTNARKLNLSKRRQTQLNARTQVSNAEFSWPILASMGNKAASNVKYEMRIRAALVLHRRLCSDKLSSMLHHTTASRY
ncbi:hypothetical protein ARMSODRAFT_981272 [Armillaria solidipes]|uniref:Uncharacterized protein n=1 Tax=Armillaria solidipes TaxID=1076256 RepID=A0A2H3B3S5_9AGAR|nr:hypothetical protein ARMSODRAFT_981272 [Armillaria solidipes]